jgi:predicted metal-dependent peptidase
MIDNDDFDLKKIREETPALYALIKARIFLLIERPFFGQIVANLNFVEANSWCETAATNGRDFFYNSKFVLSLTPEGLIFLVGHEALHCVLLHMTRRGTRDPAIFNMAADYLINYMLVENRVGNIKGLNALYDANFTDDMTTEEIYNLLIENCVKIVMTLDEHIDIYQNEVHKRRDGKPVTVRVSDEDNGPPVLVESDRNEIKGELRDTLIRATHSLDSSQIPGAFNRIIGELVEPHLDWRSMLDTHIRSSVRNNTTFQKISRRTWGMKHTNRVRRNNAIATGKTFVAPPSFIFPARDRLDTIEVDIAIDASGSLTGEMLTTFVSEVKGIMEMFPDFVVRLWSFDTQVHESSYIEFRSSNIDEMTDWKNKKLKGGGGTMFESNWTFMRKRNLVPKRFIMFTDGLPNQTWGDPDYCDTLFVIYGDKQKTNRIVAPFGLTAYFD